VVKEKNMGCEEIMLDSGGRFINCEAYAANEAAILEEERRVTSHLITHVA